MSTNPFDDDAGPAQCLEYVEEHWADMRPEACASQWIPPES